MSEYPRVSVILPVYNGADLVQEAISSVLSQTLTEFELIVLDDGSRDATWNVVSGMSDPRIRPFRHENMGLPATLNKGISLARAPFIARLDHDDLMLPQRLEKQVAFLEANPNVGMVGTWAQIYEDSRPSARYHRHPVSSEAIRLHLLFDNTFVHASVILREEVLYSIGVYTVDRDRLPPEDYQLWSRVARSYDVANIPESLTVYREVQSSLSGIGYNPFLEKVLKFSAENIHFYTHDRVDMETCSRVSRLYHGQEDASKLITRGRALEVVDLAASRILRAPEQNLEFENLSRNIKHKISTKYGFHRLCGRAKNLASAALSKVFR